MLNSFFSFQITVTKRQIQPVRESEEDFVDSPATVEKKHKEANWQYMKQAFKNTLNGEGISDDMFEDPR